MGGALQAMLMPAEGTYTKDFTGFDAPEPNSLLLIRRVGLRAADPGRAGRFLVDALGARGVQGSPSVSAEVGATVFDVLPVASGEEAKPWPGQFYVWVHNIQETWAACKSFQAKVKEEVILEALCLKEETKVDALLVRDPASGALFMVNQAPKGYTKIAAAAGLLREEQHSNALAVMDVRRLVPPGCAEKLAAFYKNELAASVRLEDGAYRVRLAMGTAVRQTLTFQDDADLAEGGAAAPLDALTITMPSQDAFASCRGRLGAEAEEGAAGELRVARCLGSAPRGDELRLEHVLLAPSRTGAMPTPVDRQAKVAGEAKPGGAGDDAWLGA
mmetsp:Transcript_61105/g.176074  ORF Transcript_61105/g.176074 Transcript_61105/m.176074 type:complete len:330 (+) Transcript_61105:58-1047(+)|eukprot:CAMPEP_0176136622 /NCGR_PEP_ID=MMETSP0120_2-20121206/69337_1 /TAXON_ID=160619 /ORGANISM="Kryptoperidinium foliaceum, Strain CCMP 1326" /LENGTH=329 /DNA_ID=CAMNT_0017472407 /DNA_START=58 /DNA_END=1047 /DNA_ORIENTATION=+